MHIGRYVTYALDGVAVVGLIYWLFRPRSAARLFILAGSVLYLVAVLLLSGWWYSLGPYLDVHRPLIYQFWTDLVGPLTGIIALIGVVLGIVGVVRDWRETKRRANAEPGG